METSRGVGDVTGFFTLAVYGPSSIPQYCYGVPRSISSQLPDGRFTNFHLCRFNVWVARYSTRWPGFGLYPNMNNFSRGAPWAITLATYSPIAGPFLKPCPEPPPTI